MLRNFRSYFCLLLFMGSLLPSSGTAALSVHDSIVITRSSDTVSVLLSVSTEQETDTVEGAFITTIYTEKAVAVYFIEITTIDIISYVPPSNGSSRIEITGFETTTKRDSTFLRNDTISSTEVLTRHWQDADYDKALQLYPNPTPDVLTIELGMKHDEGEKLSLEIFDERGRHLMRKDLTLLQSAEISLGHLPTANYHLVLHWNGRRYDRKIIRK